MDAKTLETWARMFEKTGRKARVDGDRLVVRRSSGVEVKLDSREACKREFDRDTFGGGDVVKAVGGHKFDRAAAFTRRSLNVWRQMFDELGLETHLHDPAGRTLKVRFHDGWRILEYTDEAREHYWALKEAMA
jgi:hypothetical protein